jgi:hypothetical protein
MGFQLSIPSECRYIPQKASDFKTEQMRTNEGQTNKAIFATPLRTESCLSHQPENMHKTDPSSSGTDSINYRSTKLNQVSIICTLLRRFQIFFIIWGKRGVPLLSF